MLFTINKLNKFYLQSTENKLIELEVPRKKYISKKAYFYLTMHRKSGIIIVVGNNAYSAWMNQRTSALSIDYNTPISPRTYSTKRARRHASFAFEYFLHSSFTNASHGVDLCALPVEDNYLP